MKLNAFQRYKYSADFYNFVIKEVGDTINVEYYFSGTVFLQADLDNNQRLTVRTDEPLPIGSLVANIKDSNGDLILDDMIWRIETLAPVFSPFNAIENYRSRATKYQGELNV